MLMLLPSPVTTPTRTIGAVLRWGCGWLLQGHVAPTRHDATHRFTISKATKERGAEMDRMAAELQEARAAADKLRQQWQGAVSRRRVCEEEVCEQLGRWVARWAAAAARPVHDSLGEEAVLAQDGGCHTPSCRQHASLASTGKTAPYANRVPAQLLCPPPPHPLQLASLRTKMQVVLNKSRNDDELIRALRSELASKAGSGWVGRQVAGWLLAGWDS